jgi:hypothetical protein
MKNSEITTGPGPVHPETGTRRLNLWRESTAGGQWGDMAIAADGYGYTATYISDDGFCCAEVSIYPVLYKDGSYGVDEQATIGRLVCDEDGVVRPDDQAEISYEGGSALAFASLEDAQHKADQLGQQDQSFAIYLRKNQ